MNRIETTDKASRHRTVSVAASPFVTIQTVLDFAIALAAADLPPDTRIQCRHASDTRHLVGFLVSHSEETPTAGKAS